MFGCTAGLFAVATAGLFAAFGLGRSRAAGPVGRSEASRLLLAGRPVHAGPAGGGALRVRSGCCCWRGRGGRPLLLLIGRGRRTRRTTAAAAAWLGEAWPTAAAAAAAAAAAGGRQLGADGGSSPLWYRGRLPGPARSERPACAGSLLAAGGQGFVYTY